MTSARIRGRWLSVFCMLLAVGCDHSNEIKKLESFHLTIGDGCKVDPPWYPVRKGKKISWKPKTTAANYLIRFNDYAPFDTSIGAATVDVQPYVDMTINGGRCHDPSHPAHTSDCYFQYEVWKDGQKCGDPGIHVIQ